jgi:hypothetical protein
MSDVECRSFNFGASHSQRGCRASWVDGTVRRLVSSGGSFLRSISRSEKNGGKKEPMPPAEPSD